ncbi:hypothetical protein [Pseudalgibacter alginicilyticus]|nr:hypothetical protein [Pseudalgibacter alginicilyticus]
MAKYCSLGIILAVFIFHCVTHFIYTGEFYNAITLKYIISTLIGAFAGGFVFLLFIIDKKDRRVSEKALLKYIRDHQMLFFIRNMIAFSLGGFIFILIKNVFKVYGSSNLIQNLFSTSFIIDYIGIALAMTVFSLFFFIGLKKRLNLLYGNKAKI